VVYARESLYQWIPDGDSQLHMVDKRKSRVFRPGTLCLKCHDDWLTGKINTWYIQKERPSTYLPEEVLVLIRLSGKVIMNIDPETGYESGNYGQDFGPKVRCLNCGGRGVWPGLDSRGDNDSIQGLQDILDLLMSKEE